MAQTNEKQEKMILPKVGWELRKEKLSELLWGVLWFAIIPLGITFLFAWRSQGGGGSFIWGLTGGITLALYFYYFVRPIYNESQYW